MISRRVALAGLLVGGAGLAATGVLASRDARRWIFGPTAFAAEPKPLAIPEAMAGEMRDGVRTYDLGLQKGLSQFFDGVETRTLGINGAYLGPTLKMRAGETVRQNAEGKPLSLTLITTAGNKVRQSVQELVQQTPAAETEFQAAVQAGGKQATLQAVGEIIFREQ